MADRSATARHRFAVGTAVATWALLFLGGLVTSTGSALAVPDWPLSFGQVFPPMTGGVLFEHGHRLAASGVGLLTLALTIWTVVAESRPAVRALAIAMLVAVVLQGVLGGVTVLYKLPLAVSVTHACLAQAFFCLAVSMAVATGPSWGPPRHPALTLRGPVALIAAAATLVVFGQLVLGALVRHMGAGLAIPDFPLAFGRLVPPLETTRIAVHYAHRVGAVLVATAIGLLVAAIVRRAPGDPRLRRLAILAGLLVLTQIALGATIVWSHRAVVPTTIHLVTGAALLATCVVTTLRAARVAPRAVAPAHVGLVVPA